MERSPPFVIRLVRVRAGFQQDADSGRVYVVGDRQVQRRVAVLVAYLGVGAGCRQRREDSRIAAP